MQVSKYFQEGIQAAHQGAARFCRYKLESNILDFYKGYDSVCRSHQVMRFNSDPRGKSKQTYQDSPDLVYVGTLAQCEDKAVTLKQADRAGFFVVYSAEGKPYQYKAANEK